MTDNDSQVLREHIRDTTRWVIGDAVGDRLSAGQSDALAEEIALILASGLAPVLRREVEQLTDKAIAGLQKGPVSFTGDHELLVDGFAVPDLVKLLDAVGRLIDADADARGGVGRAISALHETHRRMLYRAHDHWRTKNGLDSCADRDPELE